MPVIARRQKRKRQRLIRLLLLILIVGIISVLIVSHFPKKDHAVAEIPNLAQIASLTPTTIPTPFFGPNSTSLGNAVQSALVGTHGSYGIVVVNLKTNETYTQNAQKAYLSGSLYKLWIMATVYQEIQQGKLHLKDKLTKNVVDLNKEFDIDPSLAEKTSGTITYTIKDALYQMITISDNYAALLLADKVGLTTTADFLQKNGFSESKVGMHGKSPITTPQDIALFFDKLHKGQLINKAYSNSMLDLLKQQRLNDKIPEYLPTNVVVAHKTGELDDVTHDAGIVYAPFGDYIIVVLSQIDDRELANERIANVSKAVYTYFTSQ